jgi:acetyltransferase-like isoleucine patch superfamily enzyme
MNFNSKRAPVSHGNGIASISEFANYGEGVVLESGVLVFHPENILIGNHVYVGHQTILKGYFRNQLVIGEGTWIGQQCFLHAAGGIVIGRSVGIGPGVKIITSVHDLSDRDVPVIDAALQFHGVVIGDGADIGTGAILLPGVSVGEGAVIGAGALVRENAEPYAIYAGVPARIIRKR